MKESCKSNLFVTTCKFRTWRSLFEPYGVLLNLEALDSYKIIYTTSVRRRNRQKAGKGGYSEGAAEGDDGAPVHQQYRVLRRALNVAVPAALPEAQQFD